MFSNREELEFNEQPFVSSLQQHTVRTFAWMALGLLITTIVAFAMSSTGLALDLIYSTPYMPMIFLFIQIGVVVALVARLRKISSSTATMLFLVYAALTGVTFSVIALAYTGATIALAFGVTVVYFGSLVVIGYTTKMNLLRFGPLIFTALIALIICEFVLMLMGQPAESMLFAAIGLIIFTALTAYDVQKMKALYEQNQGDEAMLKKLSIYSALELYLDFINIFIYILRFLGNKN